MKPYIAGAISLLSLGISLSQAMLAQSHGPTENAITARPCGARGGTAPSASTPENILGLVLLTAELDKLGAVHRVTFMSGPANLKAAAIAAAKGWKRSPPANMNGATRRQTTLMVTLIKGAAPRIIEGMPAGVPGCGPPIPQRVRVASAIMANLLLKRVPPVYPPQAQTDRVEGIVLLRIVIDKRGQILSVTSLSGPPALVSAAVEAVKQWKYESYLINGDPVEVDTTVEVAFKL